MDEKKKKKIIKLVNGNFARIANRLCIQKIKRICFLIREKNFAAKYMELKILETYEPTKQNTLTIVEINIHEPTEETKKKHKRNTFPSNTICITHTHMYMISFSS